MYTLASRSGLVFPVICFCYLLSLSLPFAFIFVSSCLVLPFHSNTASLDPPILTYNTTIQTIRYYTILYATLRYDTLRYNTGLNSIQFHHQIPFPRAEKPSPCGHSLGTDQDHLGPPGSLGPPGLRKTLPPPCPTKCQSGWSIYYLLLSKRLRPFQRIVRPSHEPLLCISVGKATASRRQLRAKRRARKVNTIFGGASRDGRCQYSSYRNDYYTWLGRCECHQVGSLTVDLDQHVV